MTRDFDWDSSFWLGQLFNPTEFRLVGKSESKPMNVYIKTCWHLDRDERSYSVFCLRSYETDQEQSPPVQDKIDTQVSLR